MIDWAAARLDYVTHHKLTYRDIAEHAAMPPISISRENSNRPLKSG
jgi:hypothetical protein